MHPDLYLAMHRERERELVGRLERARALRERTGPVAPSDGPFQRLAIDARRPVKALVTRERDLTRTNAATPCCATA